MHVIVRYIVRCSLVVTGILTMSLMPIVRAFRIVLNSELEFCDTQNAVAAPAAATLPTTVNNADDILKPSTDSDLNTVDSAHC